MLPPQIDLSAVPLEYFDLALKGAAAPSGLTSMSPPFCWSSESESAFVHFKQLFTMAPVLRNPDPRPPSVCGWVWCFWHGSQSSTFAERPSFQQITPLFLFSLEVCLPLRGTTTWETENCWPNPLDLLATVVFSAPYSFYRKVSNGLAWLKTPASLFQCALSVPMGSPSISLLLGCCVRCSSLVVPGLI